MGRGVGGGVGAALRICDITLSLSCKTGSSSVMMLFYLKTTCRAESENFTVESSECAVDSVTKFTFLVKARD